MSNIPLGFEKLCFTIIFHNDCILQCSMQTNIFSLSQICIKQNLQHNKNLLNKSILMVLQKTLNIQNTKYDEIQHKNKQKYAFVQSYFSPRDENEGLHFTYIGKVK